MRLDHLLSRERARKRKRKRRRPEVERGGGKSPKREKEGERKRAGAAESAAGQSRNLAEDLNRFQGPPETHLENRTTQRSEEGKEEVRIDPGKGERLWRGGATRNWGKSRPVRETRSQDRGERSSKKGHREDAKAPSAEEGRGKLREATRSRKRALIRGYPNGGTRRG